MGLLHVIICIIRTYPILTYFGALRIRAILNWFHQSNDIFSKTGTNIWIQIQTKTMKTPCIEYKNKSIYIDKKMIYEYVSNCLVRNTFAQMYNEMMQLFI